MSTIREISGDLVARGCQIAIIASRFNEFVVKELTSGAVDSLTRHGVNRENIEIIYVPGAFELPLAAQQAAQTRRFDGIVALGAVIRGETAHFDYVAGGCANGLAQVSLKTDTPVAFGVITTETVEQAIDRAGMRTGNKGGEAALSVIEMINVLRQLEA